MISVENVSKTYGRFGRRTRALDGVSLEIQRGETLGLIGPNGAGKTTLLSCLLGFLRPDSGSLTVAGLDVDDLRVRARTGYMPERLGFDRDLSGASFLAFHWRLSGGDPARVDAEVQSAADRVGLDRSALWKKLRTYSRGMLQRIGVAQATLGNPDLLFLDEPASGTDPLGVAIVRDQILAAKARGATIVLNSHQLAEVERVCDRVVFIDHGRLTRSETLRGETASRRRAIVRVPETRIAEAHAALAAVGIAAEPGPEGSLRLAESSDADVAKAVKTLALADVPVLEVRSSAELEELFRAGGSPS
ncbi:MAG TPA: ABC transporter ATP-binding protein [Thermoanaerobaculia bacterium]|jgi:ABC-2 type transport system ATP-binding protein|nr:ABC transporter ATP-binding protein [Thermoanaerobaculia bacterium]